MLSSLLKSSLLRVKGPQLQSPIRSGVCRAEASQLSWHWTVIGSARVRALKTELASEIWRRRWNSQIVIILADQWNFNSNIQFSVLSNCSLLDKLHLFSKRLKSFFCLYWFHDQVHGFRLKVEILDPLLRWTRLGVKPWGQVWQLRAQKKKWGKPIKAP